MNKNDDQLKELEIEKLLWIIFIVLALINIYGDKIQQKYVIYNNYKDEDEANGIFTFTLLISILIYIYYVLRNYGKVRECKRNGENTSLPSIRLTSNILILTGAFLSLYVQLNNKSSVGTPSI